MSKSKASPYIPKPITSKEELLNPRIPYPDTPSLFSNKTTITLPRWKTTLQRLIDNWVWMSWMTALTIYALFGDDIRLAATDKSKDNVFFALSTISFSFFMIEMMIASIAKPGYFFSFYFWLDFVGSISMISDIGWIWEEIVGANSNSSSQGQSIAKSSQLTRAARASRVGARAGRIIRIIRIVRLIRIMKLYKIAQEAKKDMRKEEASGVLQRSMVCFRGENKPTCSHLGRKDRPMAEISLDISGSFDFDHIEIKGDNHESEGISDINTGTVFGMNNSRRTSLNVDNLIRRSSVVPKTGDETVSEEKQKLPANVPTESKVGRKLSELTSKRVITLVLGMMFCLPLFTNSLYVDDNTSYLFGLIVVDSFADEGTDFDLSWNNYISEHKDLYNPLIYVEVVGYRKWQSTDPDDLRYDEKLITVLDQRVGSRYYSWSIVDLRPSTRLQAGMNMIRTVFICFVLAFSSLLFSKDANELVIGPIENMTERIKRIARNPLEAAQEDENDSLTLRLALEKSRKNKKKRDEGIMETEILENTIVKIGALLAIGFGEAGSEIIASNIKRGGGDIDPMIPGKKTHCIFGFCDIRNFTDTTEVLQESVMLFVNEIAEIVHNTVYHYSGTANKNIGDAFLLVWKIPEKLSPSLSKLADNMDCPYELSALADMSLISFLKIMAGISSDPKILKYRTNTALNNRMPNYCVKMGFGLHVGWAIEGAIGSEFKVDASYLSPNVNLASRLEAATKQFGVPILLSGHVYILISLQLKRYLREIDCVMVKGSKVPLKLFTCDVVLDGIPQAGKDETLEGIEKKTAKLERKKQRDLLRKNVMSREVDLWRLFEEDAQLAAMRRNHNPKFQDIFREGFTCYIKGDWKNAKRILMFAQEAKNEFDGPINTILEFIDDHKGEPPADWAGFRELTEK